MKGSANAAWNGAVKPSGPIKKHGGRVKNRRGGAPGGARASHEARRRLSRGVNLLPKRRPGAPLPRACEGKEKRGTAPRLAHNRGRWRTPVRWRCVIALFDM